MAHYVLQKWWGKTRKPIHVLSSKLTAITASCASAGMYRAMTLLVLAYSNLAPRTVMCKDYAKGMEI